MKKKNPLFILTILFTALLSGCSLSAKYCPPTDLKSYLAQSDEDIAKMQGFIGQGLNHPDQNAAISEQLKTLLSDFKQSDPPKCARDYKNLVTDAMNTSITSFTLVDNKFYNRSELAQFAYEKWNLVTYEKNRLLQKYLNSN
jgi:hypothetical protein